MNEITKYIKEREEEFAQLEHMEECSFVGDLIFECSCADKNIKSFHSQTIKGLISKIIEENEKRRTDKIVIVDWDISYNKAIEDINNSLKEIL